MVGDVLRLTLWEVVAIVLIASCMMGCDRSCGSGRLMNRVDEKPVCRVGLIKELAVVAVKM